MGIDYSYDVYVDGRDAGRFLTLVAALCDVRDEFTTVVVPEGPAVHFPATVRFQGGEIVELATAVRPEFDLSLCFPCDDRLQDYRDSYLDVVDNARGDQIAVGYVYLSVHETPMPGCWNFSFTPAVSQQSRLFLASPSIRETFATLAIGAGARMCLLDVEEDHQIVVTAGDQRVSVEVPGPCVLLDVRAPLQDQYAELLTKTPAKWIAGPDHEAYAGFVANLEQHSRVTGVVL
ncbi:hypothetical protein [Winogradskya humida]|uniref:hypothetical protein n=1 Tax=Winogradskya humida TaxID=113566 RepID=UPI0019439919|nr:hypothetical protein [Actinoplanes humidus]